MNFRLRRLTGGLLAMALLLAVSFGAEAEELNDSGSAEAESGLTAVHAAVYRTGEGMLFEKTTASGKVLPASVTKLFTALVALEYLTPDTYVTAGSELDFVAWDASEAKIEEGDTLSVDMLVEGMLLPSGNDAAYVLAAAAGRKIGGDLSAGEAVAVFVREMNKTARQLGLTHTRFLNPDGYHVGGHYSSLEDLVRIGQLALDTPEIARYVSVSEDEVTFASGETRFWENTNELLHPQSDYYRSDTCGLKTGMTDAAGSYLLAAFRREEGYLIVGVFGCPGFDDRFDDAVLLRDRYS